MRRNEAILFAGCVVLASLIAGGCAKPAYSAVWVDVDRILAANTTAPVPAPVVPSPPRADGATTLKIEGRPPELLSDPSRASKGSVRASIEEQQKAALVSLQKRLLDYYKNQALQFQVEQERELEKARMAAYDEASGRVREIFVKYAEERAPKVLRLTVIVGFPDPNPQSKPPRTTIKTFMQKMLDEAKKLREEIAAIDQAFDKEANAILASVKGATAQDEEKMRAKIEEFRTQLNDRAAKEAAAEVRISVKDLGLLLTEPSPVFVSGTPAKTLQIPAEKPLSPAPQVPSVGIPSGLEDRRKLTQHELAIWLGLNRYRLVQGAPDRTREFNEWRQKYRAGL